MEDIKTRLSQIAESKGLSIRAFEEVCNLKRGNISNIQPGGAIGSDKLACIFDANPDINPRWLICGIGEMQISEFCEKQNVEKIIAMEAQNELLRDQLSEARRIISEKDKELGRHEAYSQTIAQLRIEIEEAKSAIEELNASKNGSVNQYASTEAQAAL